MKRFVFTWLIGGLFLSVKVLATEFHVSTTGNDQNNGSAYMPFKTISAATKIAYPGDTITVHAGTYRERITPPRGGESDKKRIVYRAAPGELVFIKGSEIITNWSHLLGNIWKVTIPNSFFGDYNPYKELLHGDWYYNEGSDHHTGEVYLNGKSLYESGTMNGLLVSRPNLLISDSTGSTYTWYCESDDNNTYIYANFQQSDPNRELIEINARPACFYPDSTGRNYITVQGFHMSQAATQWAAPTAEQIGVVGTFWSKGWIIENNTISDSKCAGITLGKDRESGNNVSGPERYKGAPKGYNGVIRLAITKGWNKDQVGSHIVRYNTVFNCEQSGICGSLGAAFSTISNNHIYNINVKKLYGGSELAGIKIHAAIDVIINNNRVHNAVKGVWLDWMAQGTRVTCNLFYNNLLDIESEVNHGPYLVDNNIFLSKLAILDDSEGGAYVHNLVNGKTAFGGDGFRYTPWHFPHSTKIGGSKIHMGGDDRFYNNIYVGREKDTADKEKLNYGLKDYDAAIFPVKANGNVYLKGAKHFSKEVDFIEDSTADPIITLEEKGEQVYLSVNLKSSLKHLQTALVTTQLLGRAMIPEQTFEQPDGSPYRIDRDYFGRKRSNSNPKPGPFEQLGKEAVRLQVW